MQFIYFQFNFIASVIDKTSSRVFMIIYVGIIYLKGKFIKMSRIRDFTTTGYSFIEYAIYLFPI